MPLVQVTGVAVAVTLPPFNATATEGAMAGGFTGLINGADSTPVATGL